MKRIIIVLLSVLMMFGLVGCSNESNTENNNNESNSTDSLNVDKNLFDVKITVPNAFFNDVENLDQTYLDSLIVDGIESVTLNSDGTVTYVMTKAKHKEMLQEFIDEADKNIEEMTNTTEYGITSIEHNNDLSVFDVHMNSDEVGLYAAFASIAFVVLGITYNTFNGKESSKITINYFGSNGSKIDSTEYEGSFTDIMNELSNSFGE